MRWLPEHIETLRIRVAEKLSARQIGNELGRPKNSVIGKCWRLGWKLQSGNGGGKAGVPRRPSPQRAHRLPTARPYMPTGERKMEARPIPAVAPEPRRLSIYELTERTCKWPEGDPGSPGFAFCGCDKAFVEPYCTWHMRVAYREPVPRVRPFILRRAA